MSGGAYLSHDLSDLVYDGGHNCDLSMNLAGENSMKFVLRVFETNGICHPVVQSFSRPSRVNKTSEAFKGRGPREACVEHPDVFTPLTQ